MHDRKDSILIVDDDIQLCELMQSYLQKHDFAVEAVHRGDDALNRLQDHPPDLVVLDLMLPGISGLQVCQEVRRQFMGPILMFTALNEEIDEVVGLETGADDYVKKPVSPRLLLARIRALLRRDAKEVLRPSAKNLHVGDLVVDVARRHAEFKGQKLILSGVEQDLLTLLVSHAGEVVTRQDLFAALRNLEYDGLDRSIDLYISRLRKKMGDDAKEPSLIKTVRGSGYLYAG